MSNEFLLNAEIRSETGKGASRRLRRLQDLVPAIIYGGDAEPQMITVQSRELRKALENEAFYSHILTLNVGGESVQAVLRDLQRHPAKGTPSHADFLRVDSKQKLTMNVPLHFINEESAIGVKQQGGEVQHTVSEVEVSCLPQNLPEFIEVDMANVELDSVVHLSDLVLPEGVELTQLALGADHDQPVAAVHAPKVRGGDKDDSGDAGEEAASEE